MTALLRIITSMVSNLCDIICWYATTKRIFMRIYFWKLWAYDLQSIWGTCANLLWSMRSFSIQPRWSEWIENDCFNQVNQLVQNWIALMHVRLSSLCYNFGGLPGKNRISYVMTRTYNAPIPRALEDFQKTVVLEPWINSSSQPHVFQITTLLVQFHKIPGFKARLIGKVRVYKVLLHMSKNVSETITFLALGWIVSFKQL